MSESQPNYRDPQFWQDTRTQYHAELDPVRDLNLAEMTAEQRSQYELILAHQIARLFTVVEAIALELPPPKPARKPRTTKVKAAPLPNGRTAEVHDV